MANPKRKEPFRVEGPRGIELQPISLMQWIHRDHLTANDYNPNHVAPSEMELLRTSLLEDGWTHPVVARLDNTLVDGFHRWTLSGEEEVGAMTDSYVPVVYLADNGRMHNRMSTIRHNRARGAHGVLAMAKIVQDFIEAKMSMEEICARLSMEEEEVIRLSLQVGIPETDIIKDSSFSKSWAPK